MDDLSGGGENDLLFKRDGSRDLVTCGAGRDSVNADRRTASAATASGSSAVASAKATRASDDGRARHKAERPDCV